MKKSLLALAVLGAFAGAASAQSSVTMYGLIDANLGKDVGSNDKRMSQGAGSRLGFKGSEDLGGGTAAIFQIEHRFKSATGTINGGSATNGNAVTMFQARSYVGLTGGFGTIKLGREYDGAFFMTEVVADPWGYDTVVAALTSPVLGGTNSNYYNVNSAVTYITPNMGGLTATAQVAESNTNCGSTVGANASGVIGPLYTMCAKRPYSFGANYSGGPLTLALGYANPGNVNDRYTTVHAAYNFGPMKLWGTVGKGNNTANQTVKSWMLALTAPIGAGELRATVLSRTDNGVATIRGYGLGYMYGLSKRTFLYADLAHNNKAATEKNGYDFGIKHMF